MFLATCGLLQAQQPIITDFTPTAGTNGDVVTLTGSGFVNPGGLVKFWPNQTAIGKFTNSDTMMTVYVPNGISTGPLSIRTSISTNYTVADFTPTGPGPYITSFMPAYGSVGDLVEITGVHFNGATAAGVTFNGAPSTDASPNADGTYISVNVPGGASSGPIGITSTKGTGSSSTPFTVIGSGPFIASFNPVVGTVGTTVFIDGAHLATTTSVSFNGTNAPGFNATDSEITVSAPTNVTTGPISVQAPNGTFTTSSNFFVPPSISSISPSAGRAGTNVLITGVNLAGATSVTFNSLACLSYTIVNNTSIQALVPTGATTGLIRVTAPAGSAFSAGNFTVQPTVYGFTPGIGLVGSSITVTGANFNVGTPTVRFNGAASAFVGGISFSQLTAVVPPAATTGPISVTTTDGSDTNASTFYLPPFVTTFTPTNRPPGTRVTFTGTNFLGATAVTFGGTPAASFMVTNNSSLGATVPAGVGTGPIAVTAPAGTFTSSALYYAAPVITNFVPTHGLPGTNVTIGGLNFLGATAVSFNNLAASSFSVLNNGQIAATVPNGAQPGPITVVAPAGTNTSASSFMLDYTADMAVLLTNSVNPVTVGCNLVYTITIVNYSSVNAPNVKLTNTLPATVDLIAASIGQGTLATNSNPIIGTLGSVASGNVLTCLLTVAPRSLGNITNKVSVGSDYPDPVPTNNTASQVTYVQSLPFLSVLLMPSNLVNVSWPGDLSNFLLQAKGTLFPGTAWTNVPTARNLTNNQNVVTEPASAPAKYYRLTH